MQLTGQNNGGIASSALLLARKCNWLARTCIMNMRNATCAETQTSKVPTRVTLLFIPCTVLMALIWGSTFKGRCLPPPPLTCKFKIFRQQWEMSRTSMDKIHNNKFVKYVIYCNTWPELWPDNEFKTLPIHTYMFPTHNFLFGPRRFKNWFLEQFGRRSPHSLATPLLIYAWFVCLCVYTFYSWETDLRAISA